MNSFFFTYLSFLFKSFFGLYIEAARFYLLSSMLQESLRILFVLSALSHRPVMTRVSLFSGVRDAVLMCDKQVAGEGVNLVLFYMIMSTFMRQSLLYIS